MKLPKALHSAAKVRMDYNENHDEKGRFSVTGSDSGAGTKGSVSGTHHATLSEAKSQAKTTSRMYGTSTFHVRDNAKNGNVVAQFHQGLEERVGTARPTKQAAGVNMQEHMHGSQVHTHDVQGPHGHHVGQYFGAGSNQVKDDMHPDFAKKSSPMPRAGSLSDIGRKGDKPATREGAAKAGAVVRELQAKNAAAQKGAKGTGLKAQHYPDLSTATTESLLKTKADFAKNAADTKNVSQLNRNTFALQGRHIDDELAKRAAERGRAAGPGVAMRAEAGDKDAQAAMKEYHANAAAENKMMAKAFAKGLETNKVKSLGISTLKSGPRSASARHLAPKGEPTRAEREAAYAKRSEAIQHNQREGGVGTQAWVDKGLGRDVAQHFNGPNELQKSLGIKEGSFYKHSTSGEVINKVNGTWRVNRPDGKGSLGGEDMYRHEHLGKAMQDVHARATKK